MRRNTILRDCLYLLDNICKSSLLRAFKACCVSQDIIIPPSLSLALYGTVSQATEIQDTFSGSMNFHFIYSDCGQEMMQRWAKNLRSLNEHQCSMEYFL